MPKKAQNSREGDRHSLCPGKEAIMPPSDFSKVNTKKLPFVEWIY
jgi:hypothetical protein